MAKEAEHCIPDILGITESEERFYVNRCQETVG